MQAATTAVSTRECRRSFAVSCETEGQPGSLPGEGASMWGAPGVVREHPAAVRAPHGAQHTWDQHGTHPSRRGTARWLPPR